LPPAAEWRIDAPMSDPFVRFIADVPGLAPAPRYSYAASSSGELVFFAGQVAQDAQGALVGRGDFEAQTRQVFANLTLALKAAGCTFAEVLKVNYYIVGLNHERLLAVRSVRDGFFPGAKPASTLVGVAALFDPDALIEIEVVAARPR
jgi:2-iminobutanoate/2-iminopropanoate deaminase